MANSDPRIDRAITGWQRAHIVAAAQYLRELLLRNPADEKGRAAYERLLEVLEPTRRVARRSVDRGGARGSMWDRRSGAERRVGERRTGDASPSAGGERRKVQRRSGRDRRIARS